MTQITEKQLIDAVKQLKEIKPTTEWASLLKAQILVSPVETPTRIVTARKVSFMDTIALAFTPRKLAYIMSAFLFLVVGAFGMVKLTPSEESQKQEAILIAQAGFNQEALILSDRINALALAAKTGTTSESIAPSITEIKAKASQLAKNLKDNPAQNSQTIKDIATSLKTLASVQGTGLTGNSEVKDLYQVVVQSQIDDLKKSTLTDDQKKTLAEIEKLSDQGKYSQALEKILLINR